MKRLPLLLLIPFLVTCIDPVNLEPEEPDDLLIVDGFITDGEGPFEVVVTRLTKFASNREGGTERFVNDAQVWITDQNGVRTDLFKLDIKRLEITNPCGLTGGCCPLSGELEVQTLGYRTPDDFRGELNNTYILTVRTFNGRVYNSTPQTILPGPEIKEVSYRYRQLPSTDPILFESGVDVLVTWEDPPEEDNFYAWRVNGTYKINTPLKQDAEVCCRFDVNDIDATTSCWIEEENIKGNLLAFSDDRVDGQEITTKVGFIKDDGLRFASLETPGSKQYWIEVEQLHMSGETFAFNKLLASQLEIDGDIFDPPPAEIRGNMTEIDRPDEVVIGYFAAYSVQKAGAFIDRNDLENIQIWPEPCGDCRARAGARVSVPEPFL